MLKRRYRVKLSLFSIFFCVWLLWMIGWLLALEEDLVWGPLKWIMSVAFAPIGLLLLGALASYRLELPRDRLRFGFLPFVRRVKISDIERMQRGGSFPLSLWDASDFLTIVITWGEAMSIPCDDAPEMVAQVRSLLTQDGVD